MDAKNKITIVGAGPGDPDLITVRGLKAIQSADVLLYDALVHPNLVAEAPAHTLKIFVGKRADKHFATQEEINSKMIDFVKLGHVVRLKGGDPFVFGRGFEEMIHAESLGAPVEIIPGISSAIGVGTWNGLPVTLRGISRSFHVLTAVGKNGKLIEDIAGITEMHGTVVILMGLRKLDAIIDLYLKKNKKDIGIAVIQNGTLSQQKAVYGKMSEIREQVSEKGITTPAIIYIGEVVNAYLKHSKSIENATEKSVVPGVFQAG